MKPGIRHEAIGNRKNAKVVGFALCTVLFALYVSAGGDNKDHRIGVLSPFSPSATTSWHEALRQGLHEPGWVEGKNISLSIDMRRAKTTALPELAADLIGLKVDLIVTSVGTDTLHAKKARTIPIVMASAGDTVASGFVESLARPGGNITGLRR